MIGIPFLVIASEHSESRQSICIRHCEPIFDRRGNPEILSLAQGFWIATLPLEARNDEDEGILAMATKLMEALNEQTTLRLHYGKQTKWHNLYWRYIKLAKTNL